MQGAQVRVFEEAGDEALRCLLEREQALSAEPYLVVDFAGDFLGEPLEWQAGDQEVGCPLQSSYLSERHDSWPGSGLGWLLSRLLHCVVGWQHLVGLLGSGHLPVELGRCQILMLSWHCSSCLIRGILSGGGLPPDVLRSGHLILFKLIIDRVLKLEFQ